MLVEFQQFRQLGGDRRHSTSVAGHRYELQLPLGDGAGRVGAQPAGRRLDVIGARAVPIHRNRPGSPPSSRPARRSASAAMPMQSPRPLPAITRCAIPTMRSEILKLRNDPNANALMAGAFTKGNASALQRAARPRAQRGRALHCAFSWGRRRGAADRACRQQSQCRAADYFPNAAQANPSIFYDRSTGAARSLAQVRDILTARYDVARGHQDYTAATAQADPAAPADAASGATTSAAAAAPDTAGIANAFAAAIPTLQSGRHASLPRSVRRRSPHCAACSRSECALGRPQSGRAERRAGAEIPFRRHARSLQRPAAHKLLDQPMDSTLQRLR